MADVDYVIAEKWGKWLTWRIPCLLFLVGLQSLYFKHPLFQLLETWGGLKMI
jgi:hypothetical protein